MKTVTRPELAALLRDLGIRRGDGLMVHSALQFLGQPEGGPQLFLQALLEAVGPQGTLAVPAFNFGFARGLAYDPANTPSAQMGVLSELVRCHPQARRTPHPLQSLAVIGRWSDDLAGRDTPCAFDPGSAFERLLELDFKLLLLGADVYAVSMVHYCEQRAGVPYRSWKDFTGPIVSGSRSETRTYRMFARDLQLDPHLTLAPVEARLKRQGLWSERPLNYGRLAVCRLRDFVATADGLLAADPWSLVENRPT